MSDLRSCKQKRLEILNNLSELIKSLDTESTKDLKENIRMQTALITNINKLNNTKTDEEAYKVIEKILEQEDMKENDRMDGIAVISEVVNQENTCPISLLEIVVPWKSVCGHVFESSSIIGPNGKTMVAKCPVIGCNKELKLAKDDNSSRTR